MSEWVKLTASDGHELSGYVARPQHEPKTGLVVVQEIFGVNQSIRDTTDDWADDGFLSIAPAMFDRAEKNVELAYDQAGFQKGYGIVQSFPPTFAPQVLDIESAVQYLRAHGVENVGVVGYCFGGLMAWLSACRLPVQAAAGYYAGSVDKFVNEEPQCPIMLHFGGKDEYIPESAREAVLNAHPEVPIFVYDDAGHAFNRRVDPLHYVADAATLAKKRSLLFFQQHLEF